MIKSGKRARLAATAVVCVVTGYHFLPNPTSPRAGNDTSVVGLPPDSSAAIRALTRNVREAGVKILVGSEARLVAQGSGFYISPDGFVITNQHVLEGKHAATVEDARGSRNAATVIVCDSIADLCLLKAELPPASSVPVLPLSLVGARLLDRVIVVGSPSGDIGTATIGNVSRFQNMPERDLDLVQITAPIFFGSSGSPVLNASGEVIGVATFISEDSTFNFFAVPVARVWQLLPDTVFGAIAAISAAVTPDMWRRVRLLEDSFDVRTSGSGSSEVSLSRTDSLQRVAQYLRRADISCEEPCTASDTNAARLGQARSALAYSEAAIRSARFGSPESSSELLVLQALTLDELAWAELISGMTQQARIHFSLPVAVLHKAVALNPRNLEAWGFLLDGIGVRATITEKVRTEAEVLRTITELLQANPQSSQAYAMAASALDGLGRTPEAFKFVRYALTLDPDNADALLELGSLYGGSGDLENAKLIVNRLKRLGTPDGDMNAVLLEIRISN